jgi:hypothetical protein
VTSSNDIPAVLIPLVSLINLCSRHNPGELAHCTNPSYCFFNKSNIPMKDEHINIRQLLAETLRYWYVFAIIFPLVISAAYLYLKKTPPKYKAETLLLIKDDEKSGTTERRGPFQ